MKLTLKHSFFLLFLLSAILLILTVTFVSIFYYREMLRNSMNFEHETFSDTKMRIEQRISYAENIMQTLANQDNICTFTQSDDAAKYISSDLVRGMLNDIVQYVEGIQNVYIRMVGGQTIQSEDEGAYSVERFLELRRIADEYDLDSMFYGAILTSAQPVSDENAMFYAIITPMHSKYLTNTGSRFTGACIAYCRMESFLQEIPSVGSPYLIAQGDRVILDNDADFRKGFEASENGAGWVEYKGDKCRLMSVPISGTGWTLYSAYTGRNRTGDILPFSSWSILLAAVSIFTQCVLLVVIYRTIVNPIVDIARQTDEVTGNRDQIRNPNVNRNELARLTQGINNMLRRVESLNSDIMETKQKLYSANFARLKEKCMFLQAQINPHFLYNNLECIRGMAALGDESGIRDIVVAMSSFYRYCVAGSQNSTVRDELDSVISYFKIILLRYPDMFSLELDVAEELYGLNMPRMILEPIVENSVMHGFVRAGRSSGLVSISGAYENKRLTLIVSDNGAGIAEDSLFELNDELSRFSGDDPEISDNKIGLLNVNSRIKLLYGEGSGLKLLNNGCGLDVQVIII